MYVDANAVDRDCGKEVDPELMTQRGNATSSIPERQAGRASVHSERHANGFGCGLLSGSSTAGSIGSLVFRFLAELLQISRALALPRHLWS